MAGQVRNLKVKGGRFYARVAVPVRLQSFIGRSELTAPLGGDRREAMKALPGVVAALLKQIEIAERTTTSNRLDNLQTPITTQDYGRAVWSRYQEMLQNDETQRLAYPSPAEIEASYQAALDRITAEGTPENPIAILGTSLDWLVKRDARNFDQTTRKFKLDALRKSLDSGETHLVEHEIDQYLTHHGLVAPEGSAERKVLARNIIRAEIEALKRTFERDQGDYGGQPTDSIVKAPAEDVSSAPIAPVPIKKLFKDYIASRQALGKHKDGAPSWERAILHLIKFLGHADASRITKRNLLDWRDKLLAEGRSTKTVSDVYLACVRAILRWAFENDVLPTNEAEAVRQPVAKKVRTREKGYTTPEAVAVLKASISYQPKEARNPAHRESDHITAAKRWLPILCAFTGARVTEMAQLRKEDMRQEGGRWVLRITPDAGSVKTGGYRDVPLHQQLLDLGFVAFVEAAKPGPLFHGAKDPAKFLAAARITAARVGGWLHDQGLVPSNVQPSYGWRHRFKTQVHELGLSGRTADVIQGHPGKRASDDYGDVTVIAKARLIDQLPDYDLTTS